MSTNAPPPSASIALAGPLVDVAVLIAVAAAAAAHRGPRRLDAGGTQ